MMILRKIVIIGLLFISSATGQAKEMDILFLGNSFTFRNDLPQLVKQVFEEGQSGLTVNVERMVYGGQDMFRHHDLYFSDTILRLNSIKESEVQEKISKIESLIAADQAPEFYNAYWKKTKLKPVEWSKIQKNLKGSLRRQKQVMDRIKAGDQTKWDYVVLQSWRDVVDNVDTGYAEYAQKFAKIAEKEGIKVILYITAPHAQNKEPVSEPQALEQTTMEMKTIRELAARIKPHAVVPVALGLKKIQQNGTDLKFRYSDDMHPNQYSAFLAANMFYAAFYGESTEGFNFDTVVETKAENGKDPDGGDLKITFDNATKKRLQKAAFDGVKEFQAGSGA